MACFFKKPEIYIPPRGFRGEKQGDIIVHRRFAVLIHGEILRLRERRPTILEREKEWN